jgi:hypothetical protein
MDLEPHRFPFAVWEWNRVSEILAQGDLSTESFCQSVASAARRRGTFVAAGGIVAWTEGQELHFDRAEEVDWERDVFIPVELAQMVLKSRQPQVQS